ncbi:hydroxyacid dehydrogenase [Actinophytocola xinjiangensis]|uniref:Hydroxyacid dehydrogenase n=1 Tax=Actinophytocola xinjiangensis TaxID=485602 RepID=A0A7Z1AUU8_9PSEU|nr:D-2-hydroxyacid dehydrogenase [Actinophytocola xinjiangensis]OLF06484.1 hydroxyacid dehydrogenase [Actinophytocola xinjiangensis]
MSPTRSATIVVLHAESGGTGKPPATDQIEALGTVRYVTEDGLTDALRDADVLLAWDFRSQTASAAIERAENLRWVHAASAGVNHLLSAGVRANDVVITNSRGVFDEPMAEYVLALVLAMAKDLPSTLRLQHERRWHHRESETLGRSRALVAGTGPIGRAIGRKLTAVGVRVTGLGRTAVDRDPDLGSILPTERLAEAAADADHVVLAAPLTDTTTGMVDAAALAAMKPTARLVNVGRGGLVVQDDLVAALRAGEIAGAALDVFAEEPLPPDSPLWTMPNVIVSPHMSGDVVGWREELVALFVDNLTRYLDGRPLRNVVDKQHGYVREGAR